MAPVKQVERKYCAHPGRDSGRHRYMISVGASTAMNSSKLAHCP